MKPADSSGRFWRLQPRVEANLKKSFHSLLNAPQEPTKKTVTHHELRSPSHGVGSRSRERDRGSGIGLLPDKMREKSVDSLTNKGLTLKQRNSN